MQSTAEKILKPEGEENLTTSQKDLVAQKAGTTLKETMQVPINDVEKLVQHILANKNNVFVLYEAINGLTKQEKRKYLSLVNMAFINIFEELVKELNTQDDDVETFFRHYLSHFVGYIDYMFWSEKYTKQDLAEQWEKFWMIYEFMKRADNTKKEKLYALLKQLKQEGVLDDEKGVDEMIKLINQIK